ncbi:YphA family membrane protein [Paenibacillus pectinilyticus]|nr:hypothetical protein [Paenibacillus pectinilyticus]
MRIVITIQDVRIQLVYLVVLTIAFSILFVTQGFIHKIHLLSIGLLMGSLHFLFQQLLEMDPILIVRNAQWQSALLLAVVAVVLQRNAWEQIAAISIGYLLGDMYQAGIHEINGYHELGFADFQDQWWLSIFTARTVTIILQAVYSSCRNVLRYWIDRKGDR